MAVSPGYFRTMRIPLSSGRFLDDRDMNPPEDAVTAIVMNEAAATTYWAGRNPVGTFARLTAPDGHRAMVVGVVGNVRNDGLTKPTVPEVYFAHTISSLNPLQFVVRSTLPPETLIPEVRRALQAVDPRQPIYEVATMEQIVSGSLSFERLGSFMVGFFALAALLMATLGIYGVVSYAVRRGTVEIGTRMALGALGKDLMVMIVGRGLRMAAFGALLGAVIVAGAAWMLIRVFEIRDFGVLPFVASTAIVAFVSTGASFFPGLARHPALADGRHSQRSCTLPALETRRIAPAVFRAVSCGLADRQRPDVTDGRPADGIRRGGTQRNLLQRCVLVALLPRSASGLDRARHCSWNATVTSSGPLPHSQRTPSARLCPPKVFSSTADVLLVSAADSAIRSRGLAAVGKRHARGAGSRNRNTSENGRQDCCGAARQGRDRRIAAPRRSRWPRGSTVKPSARPSGAAANNSR